MKTLITFKFLSILIFTVLFSWLLAVRAPLAQENPCLVCHVVFKQPAKTVHAPLGMGCEACHTKVQGKEHPQDKESIILTQKMPELCFNCHDQSKFKAEVVHMPMGAGVCTNCHNPHQSDFGKLLVCSMPDICYTCHDKAKFNKKNIHAAIPVAGCTICHAPHVSKNKYLLSGPINPSCLTCHVGKSKGSHVISIPGGKFHPLSGVVDRSTIKWVMAPDPLDPNRQIPMPDPNQPGKEMSCISCHDPHSSDFRKLFPQARICRKCHEKY